MPSERGRVQDTPIWHGIIDFDGFQDGKKRYPINEDDFPASKADFVSITEEGKIGFVDMDMVHKDNFFSLCSEYHLRRPMPIELPADELESLIADLEGRV
jgi:hypothetical protein